MKTPTPFKSLLLFVLLVAAGGFSQQAMAQEDTCAVNVIHTYMNGRLIPWDSVEVRVCRPPCEGYAYQYQTFKLYWPDTILANCATRIDEYVTEDKLELSQNYPNPCMGESSVKLTTRTAGSVRLQVTDVQGRLCCQRMETLPAGEHTLSLTFPHSGLFFVAAETAEGRATCKVLCSEGKGSSFGVRPSSTSSQLVEKVERGGEGLFGMTDHMQITAYITYNGEVRSGGWTVNYTEEVDGEVLSSWLYNQGSVNIHFNQREACDDFSFANRSAHVVVSSSMCLPCMDYPVGCQVTFYDSTFYSVPDLCFQSLSSAWQFDGWYKYRYYSSLQKICVCGMEEILPPDVPSPTSSQISHCAIRIVDILDCEAIKISNTGQVGFFGGSPNEYVIFNQ